MLSWDSGTATWGGLFRHLLLRAHGPAGGLDGRFWQVATLADRRIGGSKPISRFGIASRLIHADQAPGVGDDAKITRQAHSVWPQLDTQT